MLKITNIQRGCVYDGPGIRTTVFLHGCGFRCPWCCNPETQLPNCGKEISKEELIEKLVKDKHLFEISGGGVTFSGGEPLLSAKFMIPVVETLNGLNISVWIETALAYEQHNDYIELLKEKADGFILDLKLQKETHLFDECYIQRLKEFIDTTREKSIAYRLVFVDSIMGEREKITSILKKLGVASIELIKCHNLAERKYLNHGLIPLGDYTPDVLAFEQFVSFLGHNNILCKPLAL